MLALAGFFVGTGLTWGGSALSGAVFGGVLGLLLRSEMRRQVEATVERRLALLQPPVSSTATAPSTTAATMASPPPSLEAEVFGIQEEDPEEDSPRSPPSPISPLERPVMTALLPQAAAGPAFETTASTEQVEEIKAQVVLDAFEQWTQQARNWLLGGNTVLRLGLLMLFVGLAFLAKFSIEHALLPPELRLAGIGLVGLVLFGLGWRKRGSADHGTFSLSLQGGGVGVLYLTVFAAYRLYHLLPAGATFGLLALLCVFSTAIALLQNAQAMAFIGFFGAFAAPVLASSGQGDHVGLFSYYLLLNTGIVAVAALRAWRPLNLLGFFATFGIASAWGVLQYRTEHLGTTLPFLAAFFAQYLLAAWWYAQRHGLPSQRAVDATLVFGNPLVSMGLLTHMVWHIPYASAAAALGLAAWYLVVGVWTMRRHTGPAARWLVECCVALVLGFAILAVPLALDGRWISAVWAAEGAAVFWIGMRQQRWLARLTGSALQGLAALSYLQSMDLGQASALPLTHPSFVGAALLAASALAIAWLVHRSDGSADPRTPWSKPYLNLEQHWPQVMGAVGFLWWQWAMWFVILKLPAGTTDTWFALPGPPALMVLAWVLSAWLAHLLARPERQKPLTAAAYPARLNMPLLLLMALCELYVAGSVEPGGTWSIWTLMLGMAVYVPTGAVWWLWPVLLVAHLHTLRHVDHLAPRQVWSWTHSASVWLLMLLGGNLLYRGVLAADLWHTAWATVTMLSAGSAVLLVLGSQRLSQPLSPARQRWPLQHQAYAYLWRGAAPVAALLMLGALGVAVSSPGNTAPLPYVPLLNPTDLSLGLALAVTALWARHVRASELPLPALARHRGLDAAWAAVAFVVINTVWLRVAHHFGGVSWGAKALFESFLVQAGYSLLWTLLALMLMLTAHRRQTRTLWMGGAALLGLTVAKLLLIDLSNRGGGERIVTFIGVGVLMLVIGYFAPLPPAQPAAPKTSA